MPAILDRLVKQLRAKGKSESSAYAIATSALQKSGNLRKGTQKATPKGKHRGAMTPAQRSNDRAAKKLGRSPKSFVYNKKTNRSRLKHGKSKRG